MNLCGHATMATLYALKSVGQLPDKKISVLKPKQEY